MVLIPGQMAASEMIPDPEISHHHTDRPDLEQLGKQRPSHFSSRWSELAFCFSIVMSQILAEFYITGSNLLLPTLVSELDIPETSAIWPTTALSLVVCATLLIFGRLSEMYGGYVVYNAGAVWLIISSVLAGFSQNWLMLIICRALQGLALGALLPSGMMILGSTYRPGPRKNLVFSIYGACAALGFFVGFFISGICGQFLTWKWYFYIGAILSAIMAAASIFSIPRDYQQRKDIGIYMDWPGLFLSVAGITLLIFAVADSSYSPKGWRTPYILILFILGVFLLGVMVYFEGWVSSNPLLPSDIFQVKYITPLIIALLFLYGSLGIFLLFSVLYMSNYMGGSPLQIVAWTSPMGVGGLILSGIGGYILHRVSGTFLMLFSCLGYVGSAILFAVIPMGGSFWAYIFPAMVCGTIGIDISFSLANIFITTNLPQARQGVAGALIYCTMHLGIALMLGLADIIQTNIKRNFGAWQSYKIVFWFQTGLAVVGLIIVLFFVRLRHAKSELTVDELRYSERQTLDRDFEDVEHF